MEPRPEHLELDDFMAFSRARLELGRDLNVFVGENGTGKSQLLKVLYSGLEVLHGLPIGGAPNPQHLGGFLQRKLTDVFRPGPSLASLIRDGAPNARVGFHDSARLIALDWNLARSNAEIAIADVVTQARAPRPVFIPPVDLLAFFPGFVSSYQARHLEFDETWFDTSMLLGLPPLRQLAPPLSNELGLLERLMDGRVELDPSGRFQLVSTAGDKREIALVAEGARKLGVIARLIATGAIEKGTALFWDEPETNLNPKLKKRSRA
jgi:hypothetical protein